MARPLALVATLGALGLPAAALPQDLAPRFGELLEVRVVNVEAVVTDRSGRRIEGLGPEDFRLRVDGVEVAIEFFGEIRDGRVVGAGERELPADLGVDAAARAGGRAATSYLIFVDDAFALRAQRNLVLRRLADQLDRIEAHDRAAILAFDGTDLAVLSPWTASRDELRRALDAARARPAGGVLRRVETLRFASLLRDASDAGGLSGPVAGGGGLALALYERRLAELRQQIDGVVAAGAAAMRGMVAPPGRRVLLLLAGGWPLRPGGLGTGPRRPAVSLLETAGGERLPELRYERGLGWYEPLADTANHLGYTLYPVDVPGVGAAGPDVLSERPGAAFDASERAQESVLDFLAAATGGRALLNGQRVEALARAAADIRSYYWLGFTAPRLRDDGRRRIELEAMRPGLAVRSRRATVDLSSAAESKMLVEAGLLLAARPVSGELEVRLGPTRPAGRRRIEVPIALGIPLEAVTPLADDGGWIALLEVTLGVRDRRDVLSDVVTLPLELALPEAGPLAGPADRRAWTSLDATLRREPHDLVVSVRDRPSGRTLSAKVRVEP